MKYYLFIIVVLNLTILAFDNSHHHSHHHVSMKSALKIGNSSLVPGITINGAVIHGDLSDSGKAISMNSTVEAMVASARLHNVDQLAAQLPFALTKWPAVFTLPCPQYPDGHKTERALCLAHYRIWQDFVYFDSNVKWRYELYKNISNSSGNAFVNGGSEGHNHTTDSIIDVKNDLISSDDDNYAISIKNGTFYKYGLVFREEDIMVIFEDDADNTIVDLPTTIVEELGAINVDLLYLGWCDGRMARPVPLCTHSYALTRKGARKLIDKFEPCGMALDEQMVIMAKNNWISWRKAHPHSYKIQNSNYPVWGDKNYGIFHQRKKDLGSINGHRRD